MVIERRYQFLEGFDAERKQARLPKRIPSLRGVS